MNPLRNIRPDSTGGRTLALLRARGPLSSGALATELATTELDLIRNLAYPEREGVLKKLEVKQGGQHVVFYALPEHNASVTGGLLAYSHQEPSTAEPAPPPPAPAPAADFPKVPTFTKAAARAAADKTAEPKPELTKRTDAQGVVTGVGVTGAELPGDDPPRTLTRFEDLGKAMQAYPGRAVDAIPDLVLTIPTPPSVIQAMASAIDTQDVQSYAMGSPEVRMQIQVPAPGPLAASMERLIALTEATPASPAPHPVASALEVCAKAVEIGARVTADVGPDGHFKGVIKGVKSLPTETRPAEPAPAPMVKAWPTVEPKTQAANDERADVRDLVREAAEIGGFEPVNEALGANAARELLSSAMSGLEVKTLDMGVMESGRVVLVLDAVHYVLKPELAKRLLRFLDRIDIA